MGADAARDIVTGNDVQVIREILFGEQSQRIGEHFSKLESLIASLQEENQQLRQALAAEVKARQEENQARQKQTQTAQKDLLAQIQDLHEQTEARFEQESKTRQAAVTELERSTNDRFQKTQQESDQQFEAIREKHSLDMSRLVGLLASALAGYQEQTK